jgi:hypothetical protein
MIDRTTDPDYAEAKSLTVRPEIDNCIDLVRTRRHRDYLRHEYRNVPLERLLSIAAIILAFAAGLLMGR